MFRHSKFAIIDVATVLDIATSTQSACDLQVATMLDVVYVSSSAPVALQAVVVAADYRP